MEQHKASIFSRLVVYQLCVLLVFQSSHPAFADGIAVATSNTQINQAGNGVPVIDIAKPNDSGVSHNIYREFNVGQEGAILNNSTEPLTKTQLGGLIQNNPNLDKKSADLIINEVNGSNQSKLQGYLEVAGKQAAVVVANPNGITCDGCGFINTPKVTLSTGKPVLDAQGNLQELDVKKGTVTIGAHGLDASRQDSIDVVARATQLNGALHGKDVNLVLGANRVNQKTGEIKAQQGEGPVPQVAIDTSALGGMYAGRIRLTSSDSGVGVNLDKVIASQGNIELDASGKIHLSNSAANNNVVVKGNDDVAIEGQLQAGQSIEIVAGKDTNVTKGDLYSGNRASISARNIAIDHSRVVVGGSQESTPSQLTLNARQTAQITTSQLASTKVDVHAHELLQQGSLAAKKLEVEGHLINNQGEMLANQAVIKAHDSFVNGGDLVAGDSLQLAAGDLNNQGLVQAQKEMALTLEGSGHNSGQIIAGDSISLVAHDKWLQTETGRLAAANDANLAAQDLSLAGETLAGRLLSLNSEALSNRGNIVAYGNLQLANQQLSNFGKILTTGTLNWDGQTLTNEGWLQSGKSLRLNGERLTNHGTVLGQGVTELIAAQRLENQGSLVGQQLHVRANQFDSQGLLQSSDGVNIQASESRIAGNLLAGGDLNLASTSLHLAGEATIGGAANLSTNTGTSAGEWAVSGGAVLKADSWQNQGSFLASDLQLTAHKLTNAGLLAGLHRLLLVSDQITNEQQGELLSKGDVILQGQQLLQSGRIVAQENVRIGVDRVAQQGLIVADEELSLDALELNNQGIMQSHSQTIQSQTVDNLGTLAAASGLQLIAGDVVNSGSMESGGDLTVQAEHLDNQGRAIGVNAVLTLDSSLENSGTLGADQLQITAKDTVMNQGDMLGGRSLTVQGSQLISKGQLLSNGTMSLGGQILTLAGLTQASNDLSITSQDATFSGNVVAANLNVQAKSLTLPGRLEASDTQLNAGQLTIDGALLTDNLTALSSQMVVGGQGKVIARGQQSITTDTLTQNGLLASGGDMHLAAQEIKQTGSLATGGLLAITDANRLNNQGSISAGRLQLAADQVDNQGQLATEQQMVLQSRLLSNSGRLQAGAGMTVTAGTLTNQGDWLSGQDMSMQLTQLANTGSLAAGGSLTLDADGLISQQGKLLAGQDLRFDAAGFTQSAAGVTAANGSLLLDLDQNFDSQGLISAKGPVTVQAQGLSQMGALISQGAVQLTATGDAVLGGELQSGGAVMLKADRLSSQGAVQSSGDLSLQVQKDWVHTGRLNGNRITAVADSISGAGEISSAGWLSISGRDLAQQGSWLSSADLQIQADTLTLGGTVAALNDLTVSSTTNMTSQSASQLLAGNNLNVTAATLDQRGLWQSGQDFAVQGGAVRQYGNWLAGDGLTLQADSWLLSGKTQAHGSLQATVGGDVVLTGSLRGQDALTLQAQSLAMSGELMATGPVALQTQGVLENSGKLASHDLLSLRADQIRQNGQVQAAKAQITTGTLSNQGETLVQNQLDISTPQLTNSGRLQAGQLVLQQNETLSNSGTLLSGGALQLENKAVSNSGTLQGGALSITTQRLDNLASGQIRTGLLGVIEAVDLTNNGQVSGDGILTLQGQHVTNSGVFSAQSLSVTPLQSLINTGTFYGSKALTLASDLTQLGGSWLSDGDLTLKLASPFTNNSSLSAKGILTLDVQGALTNYRQLFGGQGLRLYSQGALTNYGSLSTQGAFLAESASLTNSGSIQALGGASFTTPGSWRNSGVIAAGGPVEIHAADMFSQGLVYSGKDLTIAATGDIRNQNATLYAEQGAHISSGGTLTNASGVIDAGAGDLYLNVANLVNKRLNFSIQNTQSSSGSYLGNLQLNQNDALVPEHHIEWIFDHFQPSNSFYYRPEIVFAGEQDIKKSISTTESKVVEDSPASQIIAGGNLNIQTGVLTNDASGIYSGGNANINAGQLINKSYETGTKTEYAVYTYQGTSLSGYYSVEGGSTPNFNPSYKLFYQLSDTESAYEHQQNINAIISAGGNITGNIQGQIDNLTIKAHAGPVSHGSGGSVSVGNGSSAGAPQLQSGALTQGLSLTPVGLDNGVAFPEYHLPQGQNGLFVVNDKPDSRYLIEVNPLLSGLSTLGDQALATIHGNLTPQYVAAGTGNMAIALPNQPQGHEVGAVALPQPAEVPAATITVPNGSTNSLPLVPPSITTAPHVETSPLLTQPELFLGSDYFCKQLGYNPDKEIKFLGDAAFDTRVIRDAVLQQTGQRYLRDGLGSDLTQMRWLIENAAAAKQSLGLTAGISLTTEQVSNLTSSIVWWEPVQINGKHVLAPKLYLAKADQSDLQGSQILAKNMALQAGSVNNDGTIRASQNLQLVSQTGVQNQGKLTAGGDLTLVAVNDIVNRSGQMTAQNIQLQSLQGSVINETQVAQQHVDVDGMLSEMLSDKSRFSRTDIGNTATIQAAGNLSIGAAQDIRLSAAELLAGLDMTLKAGGNIAALSLENRHVWEDGKDKFQRIDPLSSSLNATGNLSLLAANDVRLQAAALKAGDSANLLAGHDLQLQTADSLARDELHYRNGYAITQQTEQKGSGLVATHINLEAGHDLLARAATVQASDTLHATAQNDLLITAGEATDHSERYRQTKSSGFLSSKVKTTHDISDSTSTIASDFGAKLLELRSGKDLAVQGSQVISDDGTSLIAGRDLTVETVATEGSSSHFSETRRSGLMKSGGIGVTIGKQQLSSDVKDRVYGASGSSIGSLTGDVSMQAGGDLAVSGSDLIAGKNMSLSGQDVTISSIQQVHERDEEQKSKKGGLTLALSGGAGQAVQAAQSAYNTLNSAHESSNSRLTALQGVKAGMSGYQSWQQYQQLDDPKAAGDSFIGISLSVGNQSSSSKSHSFESNALSSELNAGGNIEVLARGDGQKDAAGEATNGDLSLTGSSIKGQDVTLIAAHDLTLQSAQNESKTTGSNKSSGWNAGISFGIGDNRSGLKFFADANKAQGKENGDTDSFTETNLMAGKTLTLQSGRDTTLTGALATGDKLVVDVGRDLTLTSQQDKNHYDSKQTSASASVSFGYGDNSVGGSLSLNKQTVKSNFVSVIEQTGLYAGQQGFDVSVGEHTQLNGAVLASSASEEANHLSTGTLGWSDLHNAAKYQVKSQGINLSSSMASGGANGAMSLGSLSANALLDGGKRNGSSHSTAMAAVSAGSIEIRDADAQEQTVANLNRDVDHAANGLSMIFDKQKELDALQEAQLIGEIGQQATQIVVTDKLAAAESRAAEDPAYAQSDEYKALQAQWGMGSDFQQGVQAATAALQGLSGGDLAAALSGSAAPYLATEIKNLTTDPNDPTRVTGANVLAHALLGAALAQAKDGDATAGALGAGGAPLIASYLSEALYHETDASKLSEAQKQNIAALTTVAGALAGGLAQGDTGSALDAGQTAKNEVENNFLGPKSLERLEQERAEVASKQFSTDTALGLVRDDQSNQNSDVLLNRYRQDPNSLSATEKEALRGYLQQYYQENAQVYGAVVAEQLVQSLLRDGATFQDYGFAYAADGNTREAQSLANGWGLLNTRDQSENEQYYLDAQSRIASVGYQKSQADLANDALFIVPGVNLIQAAAGAYQFGMGAAQAWQGEYADALGNLAMGGLQVAGGRISVGSEATSKLSSGSGAIGIKNSGWSSEVGYSGGAFNAEGLTGKLGSGVANTGRQITNIERISTTEANLPFISEKGAAQGWLPPYPDVGSVRRFTTADNLPFMRIHYEEGRPQGGFLVRKDEIAHLGDDAEAIRLYLGLKDKPNFISNVTVPSGKQMQMGRIGPQPNFGLHNNSGIQYQLLDEIPKSSFYNTRPLK